MLAFLTHQNRITVQEAVNKELAATVNGDNSSSKDSSKDNQEDSDEERLALATELRAILGAQRRAEADYVEARGMLGTGEKIDRYRHLLKSCLPPEDQEMLDENLEDMIKMMEDESDVMGDGEEETEREGMGAMGLPMGMAMAMEISPV